MEQHGEIPKEKVIAVVPARYASVRLPGKMLLDICGEPMIVRTARRAAEARSVDRVIVATDDERIYNAVTAREIDTIYTSPDHRSGSDRVAEVAEKLPEGVIVVNVQGDEPMIPPKTIDLAVVAMLTEPYADVVTTAEAITDMRELDDPNIVKVVTDVRGNAMYFSRSPLPFMRAYNPNAADSGRVPFDFRKHTGLYVFRREFLLRFAKMEQTPLERIEMLEQLRALENGARIRVVNAAGRSISVDTAEDLDRVRELIQLQLASGPAAVRSA